MAYIKPETLPGRALPGLIGDPLDSYGFAASRLTGAGGLFADAGAARISSALLAGVGALTVNAAPARVAFALLAGSGSLKARIDLLNVVNLSGSSNLLASARQWMGAGALLAGESSLSAQIDLLNKVTLAGSGALVASAFPVKFGASRFAGASGLTVDARQLCSAGALLQGVVGCSVPAARQLCSASSILAGDSAVLASVRVAVSAVALFEGAAQLRFVRFATAFPVTKTFAGAGSLSVKAGFARLPIPVGLRVQSPFSETVAVALRGVTIPVNGIRVGSPFSSIVEFAFSATPDHIMVGSPFGSWEREPRAWFKYQATQIDPVVNSPYQMAIFTNYNDRIDLDVEGGTLVGNSRDARSTAQSIWLLPPLHIGTEKAWIDRAELRDQFGIDADVANLQSQIDGSSTSLQSQIDQLRADLTTTNSNLGTTNSNLATTNSNLATTNSNLSTEISNRASQDTAYYNALVAAISSEASTRSSADATLSSDLATATSTANTAYAELYTRYVWVGTYYANVGMAGYLSARDGYPLA